MPGQTALPTHNEPLPADDQQLEVLLLSGGLDSAALAYWRRPAHTLFIDYGQRPARAERRASRAVADALDLPWSEVRTDLTALGTGLLAGDVKTPNSPSPEWWPFRNQLLATIAGAWAVKNGLTNHRLVLGTVASDGARHLDGTTGFYDRLDDVTSYQEGGIRVAAPAIALSAAALVRASGVSDAVLAWTHSCHRSDTPCKDCPGCHKREQITAELGRLQ